MQTPNFQWTLVSISVTAVALIICVFAMGGGHGTYLPAIATFPIAMLIATAYGKINLFSVILAVLQFSVYGVSIDLTKRTRWQWPTIIGILMWH